MTQATPQSLDPAATLRGATREIVTAGGVGSRALMPAAAIFASRLFLPARQHATVIPSGGFAKSRSRGICRQCCRVIGMESMLEEDSSAAVPIGTFGRNDRRPLAQTSSPVMTAGLTNAR